MTFDDLEEATAIDEETHRQFFHQFILFGSTTYYNQHVMIPKSSNLSTWSTEEMTRAGFPGCVGSTDATHVAMDQVSVYLKQSHSGFKLPYPARIDNATQ